MPRNFVMTAEILKKENWYAKKLCISMLQLGQLLSPPFSLFFLSYSEQYTERIAREKDGGGKFLLHIMEDDKGANQKW